VPSVGYVVWDRRKKLKPEFHDLTGDQIRDLRLSGTEVSHEVRFPLVCYVGDTAPAGLDEYPPVMEAQILITELTFFRPEHRKEKIHKFGHTHLDDIIERADRFKNELIPVPGKKKIKKSDGTDEWEDATIDFDEGIRPGTTLEVLSALKPSFKEDGVHHAGNSSQITDGSSAVLLTHPDKAKEMGWKPRARIVSQAVVGSDPALMLTGPITATPLALTRAGITMRDIDLVEINEAFASVVLAWKREMNADMSKVNVNGGAIALGHPTGCTGARLVGTLLNELERTGGRYGLVTMCVGGGIGTATVIERLD